MFRRAARAHVCVCVLVYVCLCVFNFVPEDVLRARFMCGIVLVGLYGECVCEAPVPDPGQCVDVRVSVCVYGSVCVCLCVRERLCVFVLVCMRESVCMCVCVLSVRRPWSMCVCV